MSSALAQDGAFARLRVRLEEEEHAGLAFAFRFRLIALGTVAVWLLFAAGPDAPFTGAIDACAPS